VRDNQITDNGVGLVFREDAAGTATGNTILRHTIGMQVVDRASPTIESNTVRDSEEAGVAYAGSARGTFRRNTLSANGSITMQVAGTAAPAITDNELRGQSVYGILYQESAAGSAVANRIVDQVFGIQVNGSARPSIRDNDLDKIALTSIVFEESSGGDVSGNTCTTTLTAGISISGAANPTVGTNECTVSRASE
jgi:parallel beta-helix repeat protein